VHFCDWPLGQRSRFPYFETVLYDATVGPFTASPERNSRTFSTLTPNPPVPAQMLALDADSMQTSEDLADENVFGECWAARHNQEIWGIGPTGMYEAPVTPPRRARALR
jgi:hypothetical protein